jgi:hypothetical protein
MIGAIGTIAILEGHSIRGAATKLLLIERSFR